MEAIARSPRIPAALLVAVLITSTGWALAPPITAQLGPANQNPGKRAPKQTAPVERTQPSDEATEPIVHENDPWYDQSWLVALLIALIGLGLTANLAILARAYRRVGRSPALSPGMFGVVGERQIDPGVSSASAAIEATLRDALASEIHNLLAAVEERNRRHLAELVEQAEQRLRSELSAARPEPSAAVSTPSGAEAEARMHAITAEAMAASEGRIRKEMRALERDTEARLSALAGEFERMLSDLEQRLWRLLGPRPDPAAAPPRAPVPEPPSRPYSPPESPAPPPPGWPPPQARPGAGPAGPLDPPAPPGWPPPR